MTHVFTRDELLRRRAEMLASVGGDYEDLKRRAADFVLRGERERAVYEGIDSIDWLLSGTP